MDPKLAVPREEMPRDDVPRRGYGDRSRGFADDRRGHGHDGDFDSRAQNRKLFIGGVAPEITQEQFKQHFDKFGNVVEAIIMKDAQGASRGFGFVRYGMPSPSPPSPPPPSPSPSPLCR